MKKTVLKKPLPTMYCQELAKAIPTTLSNEKSCSQNFQPVAKSGCIHLEKNNLFNSGPLEKWKSALSSPPGLSQDLSCVNKIKDDEPLTKKSSSQPESSLQPDTSTLMSTKSSLGKLSCIKLNPKCSVSGAKKQKSTECDIFSRPKMQKRKQIIQPSQSKEKSFQ